MKRLIILFILILAVVGLLVLLHHGPPSSTSTPVSEARNPESENQHSINNSRMLPSTERPLHTPPMSRSAASDAVGRYIENLKADPEYEGKRPINFYGRVVDENNNAVADVDVHFKWTTLSQTGNAVADTKSDSNGFFQLRDQTGKHMSVTVSKEGFYTPKGEARRGFEYANPADGLFTPDANNPVVFHLQKKGKAERLVHGLKLFGSRVDGTVSYVDLLEAANKRTPPGDLTVRCTRSERNAERKYDWTFTLAVPEGGLIESTNEFDFIAPEGGYQPSFEMSHRANDLNWVDGEKRKFFVRSRDGQHYALVTITVIPNYDQNAAYDLEWFLNPRGSRNLEAEPSQ